MEFGNYKTKEELEKEIENLRKEDQEYQERLKVQRELDQLKYRQWERRHPRIARLKRMLGV